VGTVRLCPFEFFVRGAKLVALGSPVGSVVDGQCAFLPAVGVRARVGQKRKAVFDKSSVDALGHPVLLRSGRSDLLVRVAVGQHPSRLRTTRVLLPAVRANDLDAFVGLSLSQVDQLNRRVHGKFFVTNAHFPLDESAVFDHGDEEIFSPSTGYGQVAHRFGLQQL